MRSHSHKSTSSGPAVLIRRIEGERDDAKLELRQLKVECKSLKDRLKGLQDGHHRDLTALEDRVAELQLQLDEVRHPVASSSVHCHDSVNVTIGQWRER